MLLPGVEFTRAKAVNIICNFVYIVFLSCILMASVTKKKNNIGKSQMILTPLAAEKSTPGSSKRHPLAAVKSTPGSSKFNPQQQHSQPSAAAPARFSALYSDQCCTAHCTDISVQCRVRPTNTATPARLLHYPFNYPPTSPPPVFSHLYIPALLILLYDSYPSNYVILLFHLFLYSTDSPNSVY